MRQVSFILLLFAIAATSCEKQETMLLPNLGIDTGCIERIFISENAHSISPSNKILVDSLFMKNGLVNHHYRFTRFRHDSLQTYYPSYVMKDNKNVRAEHYVNGLRILNDDLVFNFINDTLNLVGGDTTPTILLDTIPQLNLGQLRRLFIEDAQRFGQSGSQFKDTCLRAEFGYVRQIINANNEAKFAKGWLIKPRFNDYPYAIHLDSAGVLVIYDTGVVFLN